MAWRDRGLRRWIVVGMAALGIGCLLSMHGLEAGFVHSDHVTTQGHVASDAPTAVEAHVTSACALLGAAALGLVALFRRCLRVLIIVMAWRGRRPQPRRWRREPLLLQDLCVMRV